VRHGMHHEAQKLTTSGCPRNELSDSSRAPWARLESVNGGAGFPVRPTNGLVVVAAGLDNPCQSATATTTTSTAVPAMAILRRGPGVRHVRRVGPPLSEIATGTASTGGIGSTGLFTGHPASPWR
jgi:hypothetical protein